MNRTCPGFVVFYDASTSFRGRDERGNEIAIAANALFMALPTNKFEKEIGGEMSRKDLVSVDVHSRDTNKKEGARGLKVKLSTNLSTSLFASF